MKNSVVRIAVAGLVGGIIWFVWGAFVHMVLFNHEAYNKLPNESQVGDVLRAGNPTDGVYWLPWADPSKRDDPVASKAIEEAVRKGPVAMIVYRRSMDQVMPPSMLINEFLSGLLASVMMAALLNRTQWTPPKAAAGLFIVSVAYWLSTNVSDWIWYGFPWSWIQAILVEQGFGWAMTGLVMSAIVRIGQRRTR